jgi:glycine/D-amino acid oxidase-like deaminating enzyme
MTTYDWIVVGNGLAGAALSYEFAALGLRVLLLEQATDAPSATRFSYGGIPYWAGTTPLTRELCQAGIERQRQLPDILGADTQFREMTALLLIPQGQDPAAHQAAQQKFALPPQLITAQEAADLEPALAVDTLAGALVTPHGQVQPVALVAAYNQAFLRLGGTLEIQPVTGLNQVKDRVVGVKTPSQVFEAEQVAVAAGGYSRTLVQQVGLSVPVFHTQAEIVDLPPAPFTLRTLLMSATITRYDLEEEASAPENQAQWSEPGHEFAEPVLDVGVIQFCDRSLRLGQISRAHTSLEPPVDANASAAALRAAVEPLVPEVRSLKTQHWHRCLVTYSRDGLPLAGPVPGLEGLHLFTGFSSPFVLLPPIAHRFAHWVTGTPDALIEQMQPQRFQTPKL